MKVTKKKMPLGQKVFYILSFLFLISAFIYLGTKNYEVKNKVKDNELFTKEYGISKDNVFVYKNAKEILELLNSNSGLFFFAFPENTWSSNYALLLNEVAKEENINQIYYYNFYTDRVKKDYYYQNIVDFFTNYTYVMDDEAQNLYAPTFAIIKDGEIIYFDNETAILPRNYSLKEYWTQEKKNNKKEALRTMIKTYKRLSNE